MSRNNNSQVDWFNVAVKTAATLGGVAVLMYAGFEYLLKDNRALEAPSEVPTLTSNKDLETSGSLSAAQSFRVSGEFPANCGDEVNAFICPITGDIMREPYVSIYGHCFERSAILSWIDIKGTCPLTMKSLTKQQVFPCYAMKNAIEEFLEAQKKKGETFQVQPETKLQEGNTSLATSTQLVQEKTKQLQLEEEEKGIHLSIPVPLTAEEVQLVSGAKLRELDMNSNYPLESDYILLACSFLGYSVGSLCLRNAGSKAIQLVSRKRKNLFTPGGQIGGLYVLKSGEVLTLDFSGHWAIELGPSFSSPSSSSSNSSIVSSSSFSSGSHLVVESFQTKGGDGTHNLLGML